MNLLAFVDPAAPVRLITGNESSSLSPASFGTWVVVWVVIGGMVLAIGALAFWRWSAGQGRDGTKLDQAAASALARRLGLSRREKATLWDLAKHDAQHSPLDLLVSVKKLSSSASRRAESLSDGSAREALHDLCRALGAVPPAVASGTGERAAQGPRTRGVGAKTPSRGPSRPSVVSPRLIDRRG